MLVVRIRLSKVVRVVLVEVIRRVEEVVLVSLSTVAGLGIEVRVTKVGVVITVADVSELIQGVVGGGRVKEVMGKVIKGEAWLV